GQTWHLFWLGIGLSLLANSRPFEGFIESLPAAGVLGSWLWRRGREQGWVGVGQGLLPLVLVLAAVAGLMGYYNIRVTGHPLRLPYMVYEQRYGAVPLFFWQAPRALPAYQDEPLRQV